MRAYSGGHPLNEPEHSHGSVVRAAAYATLAARQAPLHGMNDRRAYSKAGPAFGTLPREQGDDGGVRLHIPRDGMAVRAVMADAAADALLGPTEATRRLPAAANPSQKKKREPHRGVKIDAT